MRKLGRVLEIGVLVRKVKRKNILLGMMLDSWGAAGMGAKRRLST